MNHFPNSPTVSVILPVYDRRHLIMRAIKSVSRQTYSDWELLIVDDGSKDGLDTILFPLLDKNPKWRYLRHSNRKLSATRNIGIHAAMGHYITFLDSDDEYLSNHLELRVGFMQQHPHLDFIHGGVELVGPEKSFYVQDARDPANKIHITECCIGATLFGKRAAFLKSGGFRIVPYSAESEFLPRIEREFSVERVPFPTYRYYTGLEDSICSQKKKDGQ